MAVLSPACCVFTNSFWPWSSVWLAGFRGAWRRWRRPVFLLRQTPAVCLSPLRSRLLDRCQSPTLGLSTLHPHTHRGNYSLGACLLSLCSTIYHQSVHRHLSSSPLHPNITRLQGLNPQVLQLPESLLNPFLSPSPLSLPPPRSPLHPFGSLTIPWQSAFIRSLWWKPIVTKVSRCQPQRPFRGLAVCTLHLSSPPCHPPIPPPPPFPPHSCSLHHPPQISGPSLLLLSPAEAPSDTHVTVFRCSALLLMSTTVKITTVQFAPNVSLFFFVGGGDIFPIILSCVLNESCTSINWFSRSAPCSLNLAKREPPSFCRILNQN